MSKINIKDMDRTVFYEGYLWMSDKNNPVVYHNEVVVFSLFDRINPFVIEGQLYDSANHLSYSIKFVDGEYYAYQYDVKDSDFKSSDKITTKTYYPNRMDGFKLKFLQYWEEEEDELCLNMSVLRMNKEVFVGFKEGE